MELENCISKSYLTIHPFDGVNSIEKKLMDNGYLVVINDGIFQGILTPCDLIKRPYKIVIDCLTQKEYVSANETIISALDKLNKNECSALPVFQENKFIGVVNKYNLTNKLEIKINELHNKSRISQNVKSFFLNNLAHEIRTPLNGLLGFLEMISELDIENIKTEGKEYYIIIKECSDRFLLIMNDLVDLALINSGVDIKVDKKNVRIENIFSDLKKHFGSVTSVLNKNVSIQYTNPDNSLIIFSDGDKIKHILYHLIDNALKFSNDNKVIYGYKIENQNIVFFVTNKGSQINENEKRKMFEIFEKQNIKNDEPTSGLGIGLSLVKKLVEMLEGKTDLVSNDNQTTFFCTIPL